MITLNISEKKDINFEINIQGIPYDVLSGSLNIIVDNVEYGFPVKIISDSIMVVVPPLKNLIYRDLKEGETLDAYLAVHGDDRYFVPWSGEFEIHKPVTMEATIIEEENNPTISISESKSTKKFKSVKKSKPKSIVKKKVQNNINETKNQTTKFKNREDFKNNLTKEDVIQWLNKKGTKNPQVQEIIYEQAVSQCNSGKPYKVLMELTKVIKK